MASSTSNIDQVSQSQSSKEITINALLDAASPATLYGRRQSTTSGLTWGYYGGTILLGSTATQIANGTLTLSVSSTSYIQANPSSGAVTSNTSGFTAGYWQLYVVVTGTSTVTSYTDNRVLGQSLTGGFVNPMTAAGDLIIGGTSGAAARLGIGSTGFVLTVVGGVPVWAAVPAPIIGSSALTDFANVAGTTTGLTYGYNAGTIRSDNATAAVAAGTLTLAASTTNYVEVTGAGAVSSNTTGFTSGRFPICTVATGASTITTITDKRGFASVGGAGGTFTGGTLTSALNEAPTVTIASAATVAIGAAAANSVTISGTTTITAFDSIAAGAFRRVVFSGALLLTHNAASLILPGSANITTVASDVAEFLSLGSGNWRCTSYTRASGAALVSSGGGLTNFTEAVNTAAPNATVPVVSLTAANAATNVDFAIRPKGTGAITGHVADSTATGGNKRGSSATDLQTNRTAAAQVASGLYATIAGGSTNTASGQGSTVPGGELNTAAGLDSVVGGGASNSITSGGTSSTIAGGTSNTISGITATIGGGQTNTASGNKSTIPGGAYATTRGITGLLAYSSGKIASNGDAQFGKYVLKIQTTNATTATLTTDLGAASASNGIILPDNASYSFRGRLIARNTSTGDTSDWDVRGTIKRGVGASTAALVGTTTVTMVNQDSAASSWALAVSADTTLGGLKIAVTGVASTTISWVASIETVEVTN